MIAIINELLDLARIESGAARTSRSRAPTSPNW